MKYILIILLFPILNSHAQDSDRNDLIYRTAVEYIEGSASYRSYSGRLPQDTIFIGNKYCEDMLKNCLCDLIEKDYNTECRSLIVKKPLEFERIRDSIDSAYPFFGEVLQKVEYNEHLEVLSENHSVGYIVSFSRLRQNYLSAEVIYYRSSYYHPNTPVHGQSLVYHFTFDSDNKIIRVLEGVIYYD